MLQSIAFTLPTGIYVDDSNTPPPVIPLDDGVGSDEGIGDAFVSIETIL
jgi:hypothetical protein